MADVSPLHLRLLENRLATFTKQRSGTTGRKRQSASTNDAGTTWPHESPAPLELAKAGFIYQPGSSNDNVECFECDVPLDGWVPGDVPVIEHLKHSPHCSWALAVSASLQDESTDPMSKEMLDARIKTFDNSWPHEKKSRFKPKIKKLAAAGWSFHPSTQAPDETICWHCAKIVTGWDKTDDPMDVHRRGSNHCLFFTLVERFAATRPKRTRARTSTVSRTSRLSTQSIVSTFSEVPSLMDLGDVSDGNAGDTTVGTVTSTISTAKKSASTQKKTSKARNKTVTATADSPVTAPVVNQPDASLLQASEFPEDFHSTVETVKEEPSKKATRSKGRQKKTAKDTTEQSEVGAEQREPQETITTTADATADDVPAVKSKRGKKRMSDGLEKASELATSQTTDINLNDDQPAPAKKARAARAKKTKVLQESTTIDETMELDRTQPVVTALAAEEQLVKGKKNPTRKAAKTKTNKGNVSSLDAAEDEAAEIEASEAPGGNDVIEDSKSANFIVHKHTPEPAEFEASPTPKGLPMVRSPLPKHVIDALSCASTPQSGRSNRSSNAENHPPPSSQRSPTLNKQADHQIKLDSVVLAPTLSPTKTIRVPLLTQTPNRSPIRQSPHKLGLLKSTDPWKAADVETIFVAGTSIADGEDNIGGVVAQRLADVSGNLTSPEKKMTVEQWIRFQAQKGEERLMAECEKFVWLFEREGNRAIEVLNGIEVHSG